MKEWLKAFLGHVKDVVVGWVQEHPLTCVWIACGMIIVMTGLWLFR